MPIIPGYGSHASLRLGEALIPLRLRSSSLSSRPLSFASSAGLADAAATVIGNATWVEDPNIRTEYAERIYPDTDIRGQRVVTHLGHIPRKKID